MIKVPKFLIALSLVGVIDAISYMVVAPSIIFYVLENGGTRNAYGIILSAFSFSSFCAKPFVGYFSDHYGFRVPYIICLLISALGGLVYLLASVPAFYGTTAVALMLVGRLMGGVGAASAALGFAYLAKAVPHDEQTKTNSLLSMTRIVGMSTGPALNVFLADIDTVWFGLHIDSLNAVGVVIVAANLLALWSIVFLLEEPAIDLTAPPGNESSSESAGSRLWTMARSLCCLDILVPLFSIFAFNANFQVLETALAPAIHHGLGWSPVGVSGILGSVSIMIFFNMIIVFALSARKVRDEHILLFGSALNALAYFLVWYSWRWQAQPWQFILPVVVGASAFPYLAAPVRSIFTKAVDRIPLLDHYQGSMQALLSMFASVAGIVAPGLVAAYVLRDPYEVERSADHRELTQFALVSPAMSVLMWVGVVLVLRQTLHREQKAELVAAAGGDATTWVEESSSLLTPDQERLQPSRKKRYSAQVEADRRRSTMIMGMVQSSMYDEFCLLEDHPDDDDKDGDGSNEMALEEKVRRSSSWGSYQGKYRQSGLFSKH
ncbi:hypothetical protein ACA910_015902 [Epithemia clementina (nom. ined.)]